MADSTLSALPAAAALSGSELFYSVQSAADVKVTATQMKTLALAAPLAITGVANTSVLTSTGYSLTGANAQNMVDLAGTWNTSGNPVMLKIGMTDTASGATTKFLSFLAGAGGVTEKFSIDKGGTLRTSGVLELLLGLDGYSIGYGGNSRFLFRKGGNPAASIGETIGVPAAGGYSWSSTADADAAADLFLVRKGAANLQFGKADAAAPVAQTLSVQSVVAGTSNTAGANLTITGSQGTGTGAGGDIIFQTAPAGTTGTSQNALVEKLRIASAGSILVPAGTVSNVSLGTAANVGLYVLASGFGFGSGGTAGFQWNDSASFTLVVRVDAKFGWSAGNAGAALDTILGRRAAANLNFGASDAAAPVAQSLSVQSVVAGTSNTAGADWVHTGSLSTGNGVAGKIKFNVSQIVAAATAQNAASTVLSLNTVAASGVQFPQYGAGALSTDASGNITATSDERLKHVVGSFKSGLAELMKIDPIIFKWRADSGMETEHEYVGFGAHNVQKSMPEAVGQTPDGYLTLSDRALLAACVNAVKELSERMH